MAHLFCSFFFVYPPIVAIKLHLITRMEWLKWAKRGVASVGVVVGRLGLVGHREIALGFEPGQLFIVARIFELIKPTAIVAMRCVSAAVQFLPFCWPAINLQSAVSSLQFAKVAEMQK